MIWVAASLLVLLVILALCRAAAPRTLRERQRDDLAQMAALSGVHIDDLILAFGGEGL